MCGRLSIGPGSACSQLTWNAWISWMAYSRSPSRAWPIRGFHAESRRLRTPFTSVLRISRPSARETSSSPPAGPRRCTQRVAVPRLVLVTSSVGSPRATRPSRAQSAAASWSSHSTSHICRSSVLGELGACRWSLLGRDVLLVGERSPAEVGPVGGLDEVLQVPERPLDGGEAALQRLHGAGALDGLG